MTVGVHGLHLIGHSMGAHITGFVGKILIDPAIPRITGKSTASSGRGTSSIVSTDTWKSERTRAILFYYDFGNRLFGHFSG